MTDPPHIHARSKRGHLSRRRPLGSVVFVALMAASAKWEAGSLSAQVPTDALVPTLERLVELAGGSLLEGVGISFEEGLGSASR